MTTRGFRAAAHLNGDADRARYAPNHVEISRLAGARPVQVDHVDAPRAHALPSARHVRRVAVIDGHPRVIALIQARASAIYQVYRRYHFHDLPPRANRTKFSYIFSPIRPLFSGWNCTAAAESHATALQNSTP